MATISNTQLTLSEQIKQIGPDGMIMDLVDTLVEDNEILIDAPITEANERFSNLGVKVLSYPTIGTRRINDGASGGVVRTKQNRELIQIFEARPAFDSLLLQSEINPEQTRKNQIMGFTEAIAQAQADAIIYGDNEDDPDELDGWATRFPTYSLPNVHNCGVTSGSVTTSIYLVQWDVRKNFMVYPRSAKNVGIEHEDKGPQVLANATSGNRYDGFEDMLRCSFGLNILDDTCIQRLLNINSAVTGDNRLDSSGKMNLLNYAKNKLPNKGKKNGVVYCNVEMLTQFENAADALLLGCWRTEDVWGNPVVVWKNMPVRMVEAILSTETYAAS